MTATAARTVTQKQLDETADNAYGRHLAHSGCVQCRPARKCDEAARLSDALYRARASRETPYLVTGPRAVYSTGYAEQRTYPAFSAAEALAETAMHPGSAVTRAPEGAIERQTADAARERAARDAAFAARMASGVRTPRRRAR
jgi:hypothetical protein